jgi:energy-coupling factor transport system permease protein
VAQPPRSSMLHRLHPLVKLGVVGVTVVLVLLSPGLDQAIRVFSAWLGVLLSLFLIGRVDLSRASRPMALAVLVSATLVVTQGFLYRYGPSETPLFTLLDVRLAGRSVGTFTVEGLWAGLAGSLKILSVVASAVLFSLTTDIDELSSALRALRVPAELSFLLLSAMRFVPLVQETWTDLLNAYRLRGYDVDELGVVSRIRYLYPRTLSSLILVLFGLGLNLEIAIRLRGFGASKRPTPYPERKVQPSDVVSAAALAFLLVWLAGWLLSGKLH